MKKHTKILSLILAVVMIMSVIPMTAAAKTYGDLTYEISNDVVKITDCDESVTTVTIPSKISGYPVTLIGEEAFKDCSLLTSVTIPDSVKGILRQAFAYCYSLASVTIPNSVTNIGEAAFYFCRSLTEITLPNKLVNISDRVFSGCSSLSSISIPRGVSGSIGYYSFSGCKALSSITIPETITSIRSWAFSGCSSLADITIGNQVTSIGDAPFDGCTSLTSITIPASLTSITMYTFSGCTALIQINVDKNNKYFLSDEYGVLYSSGKSRLIKYPSKITNTSYIIPESVDAIEYCAFVDCESLTSITIPNGLSVIYDGAFCRCTSLTNITIPDSVLSIYDYAFKDCTSLTSIIIENPKCEIDDSEDTIASNAVIYGYKDSTAQAYAEKYGREFVAIIDECEHEYSSEITTPATHLTEGVMTYTCACGDTYTESIAKTTDHNYDAVVTAPTCTEQGYTTYTCACGDSYFADYIDATGHSYTSEITASATHLSEGTITYTCECGDAYTESIEKTTEHTYKAVVIAPTCTEKGYTTYTCECGDSYESDNVDALGHIDEDDNEICDRCDFDYSNVESDENANEVQKNCSHICHKTGFLGFFAKIAVFFWKLFGTNPVCECGMAHY